MADRLPRTRNETSKKDPTPFEGSLPKPEPAEQHFTIFYGDTGHSYELIIGPYLAGAGEVVVEDPYIRLHPSGAELRALLRGRSQARLGQAHPADH